MIQTRYMKTTLPDNSEQRNALGLVEEKVATGLDKSRTCICDVLEMINFTNCRTQLFFNKYTHEHTFSIPKYMKQLKKLDILVL